jgi:hypothetical protein
MAMRMVVIPAMLNKAPTKSKLDIRCFRGTPVEKLTPGRRNMYTNAKVREVQD